MIPETAAGPIANISLRLPSMHDAALRKKGYDHAEKGQGYQQAERRELIDGARAPFMLDLPPK
jgi:hypothetical protein